MKQVSLSGLILLLLSVAPVNAEHAHEYQFGIFPYLPPQRIDAIWSPLANYLTEEVSARVDVRTRFEYSQFRHAIKEELFDIAYIQPFAYVEIAREHDYIPLARWVSKFDIHREGKLAGIFIVLAESPISRLSDINNGIVAMPPELAAVSQLGIATLIEHEMLDADHGLSISYQRNHFSCLQQLLIKKAITCVAAIPAMIQFENKLGARLRVIATTRKIPSSLLVVHKRVPVSKRKLILKKLLELEKNKVGQEFLNKAGLSGFIKTTDSDYDEVRTIYDEVRTIFETYKQKNN